MSPNPLSLIKTVVSPHKWLSRSSSTSSKSTTATREHWDAPYPGTYEHKPGRGWYVVALDKDVDESSLPESTIKHKPAKLPHPVVRCKLLHRYMFVSEYNQRRRFERVKTAENGAIQTLGFFQLDDGVTWVQCWDDEGTFLTGPYQRWCVDEGKNKMRPMKTRDAVIEGEERESRRDTWERKQSQSVHDITAPCSSCGSPRSESFRRPSYFTYKSSASTASGSVMAPGTALTTPSSGLLSKTTTTEFNTLDVKQLSMRLKELKTT